MLLFLSTFSLLPILLFEQQQQTAPEVAVKPAVSVDQLVQKTRTILKHAQEHGKIPGDRTSLRNEQANQPLDSSTGVQALGTRNIPTTLDELKPDHGFVDKPLARGVAGRPVEQTPALQGGRRAHIDCDVNVDSLAYWNEPQGDYDVNFQSPFATEGEKYISFTPDRGGWNNIRMSMEIIFVIAAATGRTLVLPPEEPLYLLHHDQADKYRGFGDFFPIHMESFQKQVKTISMKEFLMTKNVVQLPEDKKESILSAAQHCDKRKASKNYCGPLIEFLNEKGHNPEFQAKETCLIFDEDKYKGGKPSKETHKWIDDECGTNRYRVYWDEKMNEYPLIHFHTDDKHFRLLTHFYGLIKFTNPAIDNHFKRFVRDHLHYHDAIYCAAGKVVKAVQAEAEARGFPVDDNGAGGYSAMHVRRGDLQYKKVKIPAKEWYENTKEVWRPKEILYIATDERNKTFFDDLAVHHDLRFLDDYWDLAGLGKLDPNYMGMIDTIIASRGRAFAGTWFSTFSGYITRLRGYHGLSQLDTWYSFLPKKDAVHKWKIQNNFAYAFEWPDGWVGIDADVRPNRKKDAF